MRACCLRVLGWVSDLVLACSQDLFDDFGIAFLGGLQERIHSIAATRQLRGRGDVSSPALTRPPTLGRPWRLGAAYSAPNGERHCVEH